MHHAVAKGVVGMLRFQEGFVPRPETPEERLEPVATPFLDPRNVLTEHLCVREERKRGEKVPTTKSGSPLPMPLTTHVVDMKLWTDWSKKTSKGSEKACELLGVVSDSRDSPARTRSFED